MYVCIYIFYIYLRMCVSRHIRKYTYMIKCLFTAASPCVWDMCVYIYRYIRVYIFIYIYTYIYIYVFPWELDVCFLDTNPAICVLTYIQICVCMCVQVYKRYWRVYMKFVDTRTWSKRTSDSLCRYPLTYMYACNKHVSLHSDTHAHKHTHTHTHHAHTHTHTQTCVCMHM